MSSKRNREVIANERRTRVLKFYMEHHTQTEIAALVGVNQSTVSRDIALLDEGFRSNARKTLEDHKARMLADIEQIEKEAALRFAVTPEEGEWLRLKLLALERKAKLLGVDAPKEVKQENTGTVEIRYVNKWDEVKAE